MVGENKIGERIISLALLSTHELKGHYRYRDRFQLLPAPPGTPKPPSVMGHYGLLLELAIDPLTYPDRDRDYWAHDVRERSRVLELERKTAARGSTPPDGWRREEATSRRMTRTPAIVQELTRLLSVTTNYKFFQAMAGAQGWYIDFQDARRRGRFAGLVRRLPRLIGKKAYVWTPVWGQECNPVQPQPTGDDFSQPTSAPAALVDPNEYQRRRLGYGPGEPVVDLPDNLCLTLDKYFDLAPNKKVAFARAAELYGLASDVWPSSRSLSLAALVFAIETLIHADDPRPAKCPECGSLASRMKCSSCGAPKYGLTRRFKEFVERFAHEPEPSDLADRLYKLRSAIAHRGQLLRSDEFDVGFDVGGKDDQYDALYGGTPLARRVLREWLWSQNFP